MGGRSLMDKAIAVVFPVMAFVAAGFEHSIANMYLMPLAMLLQHGGLAGHAAVTWAGMWGNWLPVIVGNVLGGAVGVAGVYHVIYKRQPPT
jgi:formate/nitrite transporter FocA (FNT family)